MLNLEMYVFAHFFFLVRINQHIILTISTHLKDRPKEYKRSILFSLNQKLGLGEVMKTLILLSLVGFTLAFNTAPSFNENAEKESNTEMNEIANDLEEENTKG